MLNMKLKWTFTILLAFVLSAISLANPPKPRIIALTDIAPNNVEPEDMESLIRLPVHARPVRDRSPGCRHRLE